MTSGEKDRFTHLDNKYKDIKIDSEIIEGYLGDLNQISALGDEENTINIKLGKLRYEPASQRSEGKKQKIKPLLFIGLAISILGLLLLLKSPVLGGVSLLVGVILAIRALVVKPKTKEIHRSPQGHKESEALQERLNKIKQEKEELKAGYLSFIKAVKETPNNIALFLATRKSELAEYNRLNSIVSKNLIKREEIEGNILALKKEIALFLNQYCDSGEKGDYEKRLLALRNYLSKFEALSKAKEGYEASEESVQALEKSLKDKFQYYYKAFPKDLIAAANELTKNFYALKTAEDNFKECKENKKDINDLIQEVDKIEDLESTMTQLEIEIRELEDKYDLLTMTKQCMLEAKENLAAKYIGGMSQAFKKYLTILDGDQADAYQVDINLDAKVEHEGELHESKQLSTGMNDLVQLCMRLALVEAVYKDVDKPILVLDDPFINLDNNRLANALTLLKKLSLEYQLIYFICHKSRRL